VSGLEASTDRQSGMARQASCKEFSLLLIAALTFDFAYSQNLHSKNFNKPVAFFCSH
jgi:hypothetical protein